MKATFKQLLLISLFPCLIVRNGLAQESNESPTVASNAVVGATFLEQFPLVELETIPNSGTFWSAQLTNWPPLPADWVGLPVYVAMQMNGGWLTNQYVIDDRNFDYPAYWASVAAAQKASRNQLRSASVAGGGMQPMDSGPPNPGGGGGGETNGNTTYFYDDPRASLYGLRTTQPILTNSSITLSIYEQDPSIPYDIYYTTNLNPTVVWARIAQGIVGQTNYSFVNTFIPGTNVFFLAASGADVDGDGLSDGYEVLVSHTNPFNADTDGDGMPDGWELAHGLNPLVNNQPYIPTNTTVTISYPADRTFVY